MDREEPIGLTPGSEKGLILQTPKERVLVEMKRIRKEIDDNWLATQRSAGRKNFAQLFVKCAQSVCGLDKGWFAAHSDEEKEALAEIISERLRRRRVGVIVVGGSLWGGSVLFGALTFIVDPFLVFPALFCGALTAAWTAEFIRGMKGIRGFDSIVYHRLLKGLRKDTHDGISFIPREELEAELGKGADNA